MQSQEVILVDSDSEEEVVDEEEEEEEEEYKDEDEEADDDADDPELHMLAAHCDGVSRSSMQVQDQAYLLQKAEDMKRKQNKLKAKANAHAIAAAAAADALLASEKAAEAADVAHEVRATLHPSRVEAARIRAAYFEESGRGEKRMRL